MVVIEMYYASRSAYALTDRKQAVSNIRLQRSERYQMLAYPSLCKLLCFSQIFPQTPSDDRND